MDALTAFGLLAVTAMLVFYALEDRSPWVILAFAGACALGSVYGFLQGAWPFGVVEAIWAGVAIWRWLGRVSHKGRSKPGKWRCGTRNGLNLLTQHAYPRSQAPGRVSGVTNRKDPKPCPSLRSLGQPVTSPNRFPRRVLALRKPFALSSPASMT